MILSLRRLPSRDYAPRHIALANCAEWNEDKAKMAESHGDFLLAHRLECQALDLHEQAHSAYLSYIHPF